MTPDVKTEFAVDPDAEATDLRLAAQACRGDAEALESLLRRHQGWIFNIALRMLQTREDAEDATQEVLLKIATHLSGFRGESGFRTWAYRIMANHVLDRRRSRPEQVVHDFACYGDYLENAPSEALPPELGSEQERALLIAEARRGCLLGMLLCLDRRQRLAFILGEIFEIAADFGGEVLETTPENFRQLLGRARRQLRDFLNGRCGLADPRNPCRCAAKTRSFIRDGIVDPRRLVFVDAAVEKLKERADRLAGDFDETLAAGNRLLYREHPFFQPNNLTGRLRGLIADEAFRTRFDLLRSGA